MSGLPREDTREEEIGVGGFYRNRVERTCRRCGESFTGTPKAVNCEACRDAMRVYGPVPTTNKSCVRCAAMFIGKPKEIHCHECRQDDRDTQQAHGLRIVKQCQVCSERFDAKPK